MSKLNTTPFLEEEETLVSRILENLTTEKARWLQGYMQGFLNAGQIGADNTLSHTGSNGSVESKAVKVQAIYGTHTGNSKRIAQRLKDQAQHLGIQVEPVEMDNYRVKKLREEELVLIIVSTHGEGDPPLNAEKFYADLHSKRAPELTKTRFAVLALGDKSYIHFCKTGADIDKRLQDLGAERFLDRAECDVDYTETAEKWISEVLEKISKNGFSSKATSAGTNGSVSITPNSVEAATRQNPAVAELLERVNLNGRGSGKKTYHIELGIQTENVQYLPGDSLGIWPKNDPRLVELIIQKAKLNPAKSIQWKNEELSLQAALFDKFELASLNLDTLRKYHALTGHKKLNELIQDAQKVRSYLYGNDILDLITDFPHGLNEEELTACLRDLQPRLYSIASSQRVYEDEVHLAISKVFYKNKNRDHHGACSTYIGEIFPESSPIDFFIDANDSFRLPADDKDIIMIGPGTGIAPFRAFMQEREASGAKGKNWLFFGDRHFTTDFLYQVEWQKWYKNGLLSDISLAFSRDSDKKVYVQHKILEKQKDFYKWIKNGAVIYVCGDKSAMAPDVENAIAEVVHKQGGLKADKAQEYVKNLKRERRYFADVY